jgi:predicted GIY-YIG superfamily endonuclease
MMCSLNHSTLYVGVTSNIASRVYEHKHKMQSGKFYIIKSMNSEWKDLYDQVKYL